MQIIIFIYHTVFWCSAPRRKPWLRNKQWRGTQSERSKDDLKMTYCLFPRYSLNLNSLYLYLSPLLILWREQLLCSPQYPINQHAPSVVSIQATLVTFNVYGFSCKNPDARMVWVSIRSKSNQSTTMDTTWCRLLWQYTNTAHSVCVTEMSS